MMHLHSLHVLHRDLKLANVLLHFPDMDGKEDMINNEWLRTVDLKTVNFQIKIADLGFSKIQSDPDDLSVTYCGTPINMAPEVLNRGVYNYKADVWSLGTILFELLTGKSPFKAA
jgi:serine/threonine-protein kinase ULK/ATG1